MWIGLKIKNYGLLIKLNNWPFIKNNNIGIEFIKKVIINILKNDDLELNKNGIKNKRIIKINRLIEFLKFNGIVFYSKLPCFFQQKPLSVFYR